jgi:RNA recognition motif-containing protein
MAKKLYVGNLSYNTADDGLRAAFEQVCPVESSSVVIDRMTGRSRGFGFVEVADDKVDAAIDFWNGKELDGRKLVVNEARPLAERPPRRDDTQQRW